jgi:hypothetical protein
MGKIINIATLTIDLNDVLKQSAKYQKSIDETKAKQKDLDRTTEEGRIEYAKLDIQVKNLSKSYRDNQKFAASLDSANEDLNKTMSSQNKSTQELRDSRSQLNQISKQLGKNEGELTGDLENELALREKLNTSIDEQTEALRGQGSEFNASKDQVGEYEQNIISAFQNLNLMNGGLSGFVQRSQEAGGATKLVGSSLGGMIKGIWGVTKASLAFIATPIGIVLAVVAGAVALVANAMNRSEESTNKLKGAVSGFTGIIKGLLKILEPLGDFIIDGLVKGFELLEKGVFKALDAIASGLEFLGLDSAAASMRSFTTEIEENAKASKELAKAEFQLEKSQRQAQKIQLDYQKTAEKLRQGRDDGNKTIAERIKFNDQLSASLDEQAAKELEIAKQAENVAKLRVKLNGENKESLEELAEAQTRISDIEERIDGQRSEQIVNRVSLQKEAAEKAIEAQNAELDAFVKSQGVKAKTLSEELDLERDVSQKKIDILDAELKAKKKSQEEYNAEIIGIQNELLQKQAELAVDNANRELQAYIQNNKTKLDSDKFLSQEAFNEETARLEGLAEQRRDFEAKRLEEGQITQQDFNTAINEINEENRLINEELEKQRKEAKLVQNAIDFENALAIQEEQNASEFEILTAKLEADRLAEVNEAIKTGANVELINKKYAARLENIDKELNRAKLEQTAATFGGVAQLLGESTAAGKAAGVAQATINTYTGVSEVWRAPSTLPEPLGTAAKVVSTGVVLGSGLASVKKIASTPTKFGKGTILKGNSHANNGIQFLLDGMPGFEAEGGEAIINKKSTSMFGPLLSAMNVAGGGNKFAGGTILGGASVNQPFSIIDYEVLAEMTADAVANNPNPVVDVQEILEVANSIDVLENNSNL